MTIKTKLVLLELLGGLFRWIWIAAAIVSIYFLYGALANDAPAYHLLWSIVAGFIARNLAATFKSSKKKMDYVDQLLERGYTRTQATVAWYTAIDGGSNLLLNLRQAENIAGVGRFNAE